MAANPAPNVTWVPSPNFHPGRQGHQILAIVDHIMAGTLSGTDAWFQNPASQVSAHYGVGRSGEIHKYVRDEDTAWHAGEVVQPTAPLRAQYPTLNLNLITVGIEHEGESGDHLTDAQYAATLWLHRTVIAAYGIPVDRTHIILHHEIDANHGGCPGPGFPIDRLMADLAAPPAGEAGGGSTPQRT